MNSKYLWYALIALAAIAAYRTYNCTYNFRLLVDDIKQVD